MLKKLINTLENFFHQSIYSILGFLGLVGLLSYLLYQDRSSENIEYVYGFFLFIFLPLVSWQFVRMKKRKVLQCIDELKQVLRNKKITDYKIRHSFTSGYSVIVNKTEHYLGKGYIEAILNLEKKEF